MNIFEIVVIVYVVGLIASAAVCGLMDEEDESVIAGISVFWPFVVLLLIFIFIPHKLGQKFGDWLCA